MAKRVLVTGAAGFIGANLVDRLKSLGYWVRAVDVKETPERAHLYQQADEVWTGCDLRNPEDWHEPPADPLYGIDRVYHLAADHGGAGYFHGPQDYKAAENNLLIDQNVRKAAIANGVERLFFAGSACTYPITIQGKGARALRESDWGGGPAEASYGEAKRMSTIMFEAAREHGHDFRTAHFHTIFGPTQDTEEPRAKFPTAICRKILAASQVGGKPKVEVWGDGTQVRSFLYIRDALDKIEMVMNHPNYWGPVNVGSDEAVTVRQCANWAAEAAGVSPKWVYDLSKPRGVDERCSDNTEWERRYGTKAQVNTEAGFAKLMGWMIERRNS